MYAYAKALHIIFVVTWFAGLFYIVRLFIYHTEAEIRPENERKILQDQYKIMEKRLWYGITWPSMILTFIFGGWLMILMEAWTQQWFILKLAFVFGLILYHLQCHFMFRKLQANTIKYSSFKLRMWNEIATLLLVAIVFIVVFKNTITFIGGILGLILFSLMLYLGINIYKKSRQRKENNEKK